jgi:hydroxymethylpyrimidine/phosphomethylpyrimidine kinase
MKKHYRVLSIAGSDSGAGAGIQADLKTLSALGCYGTTAITAITSQNTQGIYDVLIVPVSHIQSQITAILDDIGTNAVKIGMLPTAEGILAISQLLQTYNTPNIVLDTIMVSSSGRNLLDDTALQAFKQNLIPIATLITPNIPEAENLLDVKITTSTDIENALKALQQLGCDNVLLKGGHQAGETCTDTLLTADGTVYEFSHPRIASRNTHGTGCTLSSAIAAYLAKGESLPKACEKAGNYVHKAIVLGADYVLGKGNGPLLH